VRIPLPPPWIALLLLVAMAFPGVGLEGQDRNWAVEGELGGSFFFGNRDQTNFATRAEGERADSTVESRAQVNFLYGTETNDDGVTQVNARSWSAAVELNLRRHALWQPFIGGGVESSLERRIETRYEGGAGVKLSYRDDENPRNRVDFSVSLRGERTLPRAPDPDPDADPDEPLLVPPVETLTRWSSDFRFRRGIMGNRVLLDFQQAYRPAVGVFGDFRFDSRNTVSYELTEVVALRFGVRAEYDSRARDRGAEKNYDGRTEVSVVARF
jgi:hypothetical protein